MYSAIYLCMKMSYNVSVSFPTSICHTPTTLYTHSHVCSPVVWHLSLCFHTSGARDFVWWEHKENFGDVLPAWAISPTISKGGALSICLNATSWESMKTDCSESSNRFFAPTKMGKKPRCLNMERALRPNVWTSSASTCLTRDYLQNCTKQYMEKWCVVNKKKIVIKHHV